MLTLAMVQRATRFLQALGLPHSQAAVWRWFAARGYRVKRSVLERMYTRARAGRRRRGGRG